MAKANAAYEKHMKTLSKPKGTTTNSFASKDARRPSHSAADQTPELTRSSSPSNHPLSRPKRRGSEPAEDSRPLKSQRGIKDIRAFEYREHVLPAETIGDQPRIVKPSPEYIVLDDSDSEGLWGSIAAASEPALECTMKDQCVGEDEFDDDSLDESLQTYAMIQKNSERPLCQEQVDLVELILSGKNVFYTGSAGCGKSTVLNCFQGCLRDLRKRVHIVAPTGRAALDINGSTFWSYASWTPDSMKRSIQELKQRARQKKVRKRLQDTDVLVIDEISMMENHHFERLNRIMQSARDCDKAFGGVQIIVTGDFCQLPPVRPFQFCFVCGKSLVVAGSGRRRCAEHGDVFDKDQWAFCSDAWKMCNFVHVNLTTIHRQSDIEFITILERLRLGMPLSTAERDLLLNHESETEGAVKLFPKVEQVRKVNEQSFATLSTPIMTFPCYDHLALQSQHAELKAKSQRYEDGSLIALKEHRYGRTIDLRIGMLVVLLVNVDIRSGLVNGSQGTIVRFEKPGGLPHHKGTHSDLKSSLVEEFIRANKSTKNEGEEKKEDEAAILPVVKFTNGMQTTIYPDCIVSEFGETRPYSLMARTQIPLMAAWAMTVHKSQGMTLSRVIVDLGESFEEGQDYVALSRARGLEGLKVERLARHDRSCNPQVRQFLATQFGVR